MARILKPGGIMEHVVPNVQWAAGHLIDDTADEHVFNVLYGAQESHEYDRALNTHYFGYTPSIARALAESCGLEDITIRDYRDDPAMQWDLIVSGRKPAIAVQDAAPAQSDQTVQKIEE